MAHLVRQRQLSMFLLWNIATCGLYSFYLLFTWADDLNAFLGQRKYNGLLLLIIGIISCSLAMSVFLIMYAADLQKLAEEKALPGRREKLTTNVALATVAGIIFLLLSSGTAGPVSVALFLVALWFVQDEINKIAEFDKIAE